MKKRSLVVLAMFLLNIPAAGMAATVGNLAEVNSNVGKFTLAIEYDKAYERNFTERKDGSVSWGQFGAWSSASVSPTDVEAEFDRTFLKANLALHSQVNLYIKSGQGRAILNYKGAVNYTMGTPEFEADSGWGFAWGAGIKSKIAEIFGLKLLADVQYISYDSDADIKIDGANFDDFMNDPNMANGDFSSHAHLEAREWQAALYVTKNIKGITPYGGIKYSDARIEHDIYGRERSGNIYSFHQGIRVEAKNNVGVFVGADFEVIPGRLKVSVEGRFFDETAATIGAEYRF
jgi:hypothetical protein